MDDVMQVVLVDPFLLQLFEFPLLGKGLAVFDFFFLGFELVLQLQHSKTAPLVLIFDLRGSFSTKSIIFLKSTLRLPTDLLTSIILDREVYSVCLRLLMTPYTLSRVRSISLVEKEQGQAPGSGKRMM